jgi:hypothetical protein
MTPADRQLLHWYNETYQSRTRAVRDNTARIDWLDPGTRVSWTEMVAKAEELGIRKNPVALRSWWHEVTGK